MKLSRRMMLLVAALGSVGGGARAKPMEGKATMCDATGDAADIARAAERDALLTSTPPRIGPLPQEQIPPEVFTESDKLRAGVGLPPGPRGPMGEFTATTARSPQLMIAHLTLANYLFRGKLPVRDRELAILRLAWLAKAPFEWGEHVKIAKRLGNATEAEVLRIRQGSDAPGWTDHERAIVRGVEEFIAQAMLSDETWTTLAKTWNDQQLLEFPILVGQYLGVAFLQNSLRVRLQTGNPGLTAQ
jgi:alkylhydroperoxidase family enzyme